MTPSERHAAVLEALDQQIGDPFLPDPFRRVWEGCRRILQRHAPHGGRCTACLEWCDCMDGTRVEDCAHGNTPWPCDDWLDAAAGVEER